MQLGKKTQRRLVASFIFGIAVIFVLLLFGDVRGIGQSLKTFDWKILPLVFGLALVNYALRFARWQYYLKLLRISLPLKDSLTDMMAEYDCGRTVDGKDAGTFADCLMEMSASQTVLDRMGKNSLRLARKFDRHALASDFATFLEGAFRS